MLKTATGSSELSGMATHQTRHIGASIDPVRGFRTLQKVPKRSHWRAFSQRGHCVLIREFSRSESSFFWNTQSLSQSVNLVRRTQALFKSQNTRNMLFEVMRGVPVALCCALLVRFHHFHFLGDCPRCRSHSSCLCKPHCCLWVSNTFKKRTGVAHLNKHVLVGVGWVFSCTNCGLDS